MPAPDLTTPAQMLAYIDAVRLQTWSEHKQLMVIHLATTRFAVTQFDRTEEHVPQTHRSINERPFCSPIPRVVPRDPPGCPTGAPGLSKGSFRSSIVFERFPGHEGPRSSGLNGRICRLGPGCLA